MPSYQAQVNAKLSVTPTSHDRYYFPPFSLSTGTCPLKFADTCPSTAAAEILTVKPSLSIGARSPRPAPDAIRVHLRSLRHEPSVCRRLSVALARPICGRVRPCVRGAHVIRQSRPSSSCRLSDRHRPRIRLDLHRLTKIPWIAEFRDPMIDGRASQPCRPRDNRWVERRTAARRPVRGAARAHDYARRTAVPPALHSSPTYDEGLRGAAAQSGPRQRPLGSAHGILPGRATTAVLRRAAQPQSRFRDPRVAHVVFRAPGYDDHTGGS